jgi:Methyltransferase domain
MHDPDLIERAREFHPWDAMSPAALSGILRRGPFRASAETGCGGSTIVLSHASDRHVTFAIEGADRTLTELRRHSDLRAGNVIFVEGETRDTLPRHNFEGELDLVLLDGPHAYPMPQVEFAFLYPRIRRGGWLVLDDIHIPSVYELFRFLEKESSVVLEEVSGRTAFFRRVSVAGCGPDGWELQGMNRRTILRYSWRDRLRNTTGSLWSRLSKGG